MILMVSIRPTLTLVISYLLPSYSSPISDCLIPTRHRTQLVSIAVPLVLFNVSSVLQTIPISSFPQYCSPKPKSLLYIATRLQSLVHAPIALSHLAKPSSPNEAYVPGYVMGIFAICSSPIYLRTGGTVSTKTGPVRPTMMEKKYAGLLTEAQ